MLVTLLREGKCRSVGPSVCHLIRIHDKSLPSLLFLQETREYVESNNSLLAVSWEL